MAVPDQTPPPSSARGAAAPGGVEPTIGGHRRPPEDEPWATRFGSPSLPPDVFAVATSDGAVYIGGGFTFGMAGTAPGTYRRVAAWDGLGWSPMGDGVDAAVHAVAVVGPDVYVGGELTIAGGVAAPHLARWDGTSWSAVAGGVGDPDRPAFGATVRALVSDGATLYVGGSFTTAGQVPVRSLAALDLATGTWSDVGGGVGLSWSTDPAAVHALALHDGSLYVGGSFDVAGGSSAGSIARFHIATGTWTTYGSGVGDDGLTGTVNAIAVDPATGAATIGGRFSSAGTVRAWNLVELRDGTFRSLGDVSSYGGKYAEVSSVVVAGGLLYVGGGFTAIGNAEVSHWARYDGTAWSTPGRGVDSVVRAMAPRGDGVVVVGDFGRSGDLRLVRGGTWTGTGWETFGQGVTSDPDGNGTVHAVVADGAEAYVGGLFDQAGQLPVSSIGRWTGTGWDAMGGGVAAAVGHGQVFALARVGADLYVAGRFATAGDVAASNIARWDGQRWWPLGEGLDGFAYALCELGGKLYVGGAFNLAGRVPAGRLACWDPATSTWAPVGGNPTYDDDIRALAAVGDRWLVVGGDFQRFFHGGRVILEGLWGMALFDTGHEPTGEVLSGYRQLEGMSRHGGTGLINAMQLIDGDLFVGGSFDVAGVRTAGPEPSAGFPASNLAVWHVDGDGRWEPVGGGADGEVHALADVGGALAVAGQFGTVGGLPASRVAVRDLRAGTWGALGSGLGGGAGGLDRALALARSDGGGLWVGGQFPVAGGSPSANLALWTAGLQGG